MPCYPTTDGKAFDFPKLQWYHDAVAWCLKNKLMTNHKDGTFGVSETASRAMIAEILWRLAGSPQAEEGGGFADVAADAEKPDLVVSDIRDIVPWLDEINPEMALK